MRDDSKSITDVIEMMVYIAIFMIVIWLMIDVHNEASQYEDTLVSAYNIRNGIRFNGPTEVEMPEYDKAQVLMDIKSISGGIPVSIDGTSLMTISGTNTILDNFRNGSEAAYLTVKGLLVNNKYHKISTYDDNGTVTKVEYIGF